MRKIWRKITSIPNLKNSAGISIIFLLILGSVVVLYEVDKAKSGIERLKLMRENTELVRQVEAFYEANSQLYQRNEAVEKACVEQAEALQRAKQLIYRQNALIENLVEELGALRRHNSTSALHPYGA